MNDAHSDHSMGNSQKRRPQSGWPLQRLSPVATSIDDFILNVKGHTRWQCCRRLSNVHHNEVPLLWIQSSIHFTSQPSLKTSHASVTTDLHWRGNRIRMTYSILFRYIYLSIIYNIYIYEYIETDVRMVWPGKDYSSVKAHLGNGNLYISPFSSPILE